MQAALEICLQCHLIFAHDIDTNSGQVADDEFAGHLTLFESRLQNALKTLTKLTLAGKDPKQLSKLYKRMYMETLTGKHGLGAQQSSTACLKHLHMLLARLRAMCETQLAPRPAVRVF